MWVTDFLYNLFNRSPSKPAPRYKLYKNSVTHAQIIECLKPIFIDYAKNRQADERFGDFTIRVGYVNATSDGNAFHSDLKDIQYKVNA